MDAGEQVSTTLKREFMEEAMSNTSTKDETNDITKGVTALFSSGHEVCSCSLCVFMLYLNVCSQCCEYSNA